MTTESGKINLFDCGYAAFSKLLCGFGASACQVKRTLQCLHQSDSFDLDAMAYLSKNLREKLRQHTEIKLPDIALQRMAKDGCYKWLLRLHDGNMIEAVFIPEDHRGTLCVSSQVGCALNCSFCATGKEGFNRNLSLSEIIGQLWIAKQQLRMSKHKITNVVMMGMGEPLLNYQPVVDAMALMVNDLAYGLSKYRVTLSTSGLVPQIAQLKKDSPVSLAVSLHAPNDALRSQLLPLNKKYPLQALMACCREYYAKEKKRKVVFEYVMLENINDSLEQAKELADLVADVPCKINLIPFNIFPGTNYRCSSPAAITAFQNYLMQAGLDTRVRRTRGNDVDAACGQLAGKFKDRTGRHARWQRTGVLIPMREDS